VKRSIGKKKTGENADGEVSKDSHEANHGTGMSDLAHFSAVSKQTTISKNKKTIVVNEDEVAAVTALVSLAPTANDQVPGASSSATPNYEDGVVCDEIEGGSKVQAKRPATTSKLSSSSGIDNSQELPAAAGSDNTVSAPFSKKLADLSKRRCNLVPCPVCLRSPLHVRYRCPIIVAGHDSIRERLRELREEHSGRNVQLIEESEYILKGGGLGRTEKFNVNPNSSVPPSTSTPPMKQIFKRVLVDNSNAPTPGLTAVPMSKNVDPLRPPGSNPAVNTPGEHSSEDSNEGSSKNDRDEGSDTPKRPERLATTTFPNPSSYASIDLDALVRPLSRDITKILEIEDDEEEEEEVVLGGEGDDLELQRHSMGLRTAESSSDEDQASDLPVGEDEGNESNASPPAEEGQAQLASPGDLSPFEVHTFFQDINGLGESLETDRRGDAAFSAALAADKVAINLAQASEDDTEVARSTGETDVSVGKTSLRRQAREGEGRQTEDSAA
jgi:hypothetical protein